MELIKKYQLVEDIYNSEKLKWTNVYVYTKESKKYKIKFTISFISNHLTIDSSRIQGKETDYSERILRYIKIKSDEDFQFILDRMGTLGGFLGKKIKNG